GVVIDANFSTLWPVSTHNDPLSPRALLALMNSSWTQAAVEALCTVMGGGALKVEATQLRRLPLPPLTADQTQRLDELGSGIEADRVLGGELQAEIDAVVVSGLRTSGVRRD